MIFAGPRKNCELFAADGAVRAVRWNTGAAGWPSASRGNELTGCWRRRTPWCSTPIRALRSLACCRCAMKTAPPVRKPCYGEASTASLPELAADWAGATLGIAGARPYVAVGPAPARDPYIAVSLGVGENLAKRIADPFEEELLRMLQRGPPLYVDRGAGGAEAGRVARAGVPAPVLHTGKARSPGLRPSSPAAASTWVTTPRDSMWRPPWACP